MSEPFDMTTYIARSLHDPDRAARISGYRDEIALDRERYLERSVMTIFASVLEASTLTGAARDAKLEEVLGLILEDPGLTESFASMLGEDLDEATDLLADARDAMLYAADPFTGVIPAGTVFPPVIQAVIDTSPELRAYRQQLIADAQEADDERWIFVAEMLQPRIDALYALYARRRIEGELREQESGQPVQIPGHEEALAFRRRGGAGPSIQSLSIDDVKGAYRLDITGILIDPNPFEVIFRLCKPGTRDSLVASREEWLIFPTLSGSVLATEPDPHAPETWRLADLISPEDLVHLTYEIEVLGTSAEDGPDEDA